MPHRYVAIRDNIRKEHPEMPLAAVKTEASKIYESTRRPGELHLATVAKRERTHKSYRAKPR